MAGQSLFAPEDGVEMSEHLTKLIDSQAKQMIATLIDFPKPLIAAVQGPALGFGCTHLTTVDIVYASSKASFATPFMQLGFCAEGLSSLRFEQMLGTSKANEMLLLGRPLSAQEAEKCGFVAAVFEPADLMDEVMKRARQMASYPPEALQQTKKLCRDRHRQTYHDVNNDELSLLVHRFMSDECQEAVMNFMMAKMEAKKKQKGPAAKSRL